MVNLFAMFLLTMLMITAIAIVRTRDLFVAVMLTGIFSLLMSAIFFILDAADVALTEAAIGAGITTVLFLGALALTAEWERPVPYSRWLPGIVVAITTLIVIYATFDKPRLGDPLAPVHQHVAPWYLEMTPELIGIPNVVTAVLGSFRGYDTMGELIVIFTACIGVLFLLGAPIGERFQRPSNEGASLDVTLSHHLIPRVVGRLLIPLIVLFGLYVQFHGEFGPGGGFQAGAIIAAGIMLYTLLEGEQRSFSAVPRWTLMAMAAGGAVLYGSVGVAGIVMGGNFLDYSVLTKDPVLGQQIGILIIEAGVGVTVCGALLAIFHAINARVRG